MLMFRNRFVSAALVAAGVFVGMAQSAHAQNPIAVGQSGVTPPPAGPFGGTLLSTITSGFNQTNLGNTVSGTLISSVYSGGTGATGLDFYYQVVLNGATNTTVDNFNVAGFSSAIISSASVAQTTTTPNASFTAGGFSVGTDDRSGGNGNTIFFNFANTGGTQFTSGNGQIQIVRTNATNYVTVGAAVIGGGASANASSLGVALASTGAPEPGSLVLMGTGLMSAAGMVVRRRRIAKK